MAPLGSGGVLTDGWPKYVEEGNVGEPKQHTSEEDDDDQVLHGHKHQEVVEKERQIQQEREREREEKKTEK
jgi:hypothetical protein